MSMTTTSPYAIIQGGLGIGKQPSLCAGPDTSYLEPRSRGHTCQERITSPFQEETVESTTLKPTGNQWWSTRRGGVRETHGIGGREGVRETHAWGRLEKVATLHQQPCISNCSTSVPTNAGAWGERWETLGWWGEARPELGRARTQYFRAGGAREVGPPAQGEAAGWRRHGGPYLLYIPLAPYHLTPLSSSACGRLHAHLYPPAPLSSSPQRPYHTSVHVACMLLQTPCRFRQPI